MVKIDANELDRRAFIVNSEYGGIIPYHEIMYISSIQYTAERSLDAFNRYELLFSKNSEPGVLISIVQEAVGHAAALSKYFWLSRMNYKIPKEVKKQMEMRAEKLRTKFGLNDDSPLNDRSLRNAWEHFDEKLDEYLLMNDFGYYFPTPLIDDHSLADEENSHIFKLLDPKAKCLVLLGEKYFYGPIRAEVEKVYQHALDSDKRGGRL